MEHNQTSKKRHTDQRAIATHVKNGLIGYAAERKIDMRTWQGKRIHQYVSTMDLTKDIPDWYDGHPALVFLRVKDTRWMLNNFNLN